MDTAPVPPVQLAISSAPEDWCLSAWLSSLHVAQITYMRRAVMLGVTAAVEPEAVDAVDWMWLLLAHL